MLMVETYVKMEHNVFSPLIVPKSLSHLENRFMIGRNLGTKKITIPF